MRREKNNIMARRKSPKGNSSGSGIDMAARLAYVGFGILESCSTRFLVGFLVVVLMIGLIGNGCACVFGCE